MSETPGSISGRVTNESGTGIANIDVKVYSYPKQCLIITVKTDADGYYIVNPINEGYYRIYFDDNIPQIYISEWYDNQTSYSKAHVVQVTANQTTTINGQLTMGGIITGRVTNRSAVGLSKVSVSRKSINDNSATAVSTSSIGTYTLNQIPPGTYKIYFEGEDAGYLSKYWDNKGAVDDANSITVNSGSTTPNINAQLDPAGSMSGKITNQSGAVVKNVQVWAYDTNKKSVNNVMNNSTTGIYTIPGLPTGIYRVWFDTRSAGNYLSEWYINQTFFETGQTVSVVNGSTTPNIDAQLDPGGSIAGKVTNQAGIGIKSLSVSAYDLNHNSMNSEQTDTNGNYVIPGLPTGEYKVYISGFSSCSTGECYSSEWYDDKHSFDLANSVPVVVNQTTPNIDAVLSNCPDKFVYLPILLK